MPNVILAKRLKNIIDMLTKNVYDYGCTGMYAILSIIYFTFYPMGLQICYNSEGIFERHKLLYSFQMNIKLEQNEGNVSQPQLDFFIKGNVALEKAATACPATWIPTQVAVMCFRSINEKRPSFLYAYITFCRDGKT